MLYGLVLSSLCIKWTVLSPVWRTTTFKEQIQSALVSQKKETKDQNVVLTSKCTQRRKTESGRYMFWQPESYIWKYQQVTTICMKCLSALCDSMFTNQHCEEKFCPYSLLTSGSRNTSKLVMRKLYIQTNTILDFLNEWQNK